MRVHVRNEVTLRPELDEYRLFFQWVSYNYDDGTSEEGYRFIWKRDGKLQPTRGQARIESTDEIIELVNAAKSAGWGNFRG